MNVGITVLVVIGVLTLYQIVRQNIEMRKHHQEIMARLEKLESTQA